MLHQLALAAVFMVLSQPEQIQVTYTIQLKKEAKGITRHETRTTTEFANAKAVDNAGNVRQENTKSVVLTSVFNVTVLEKPDPKKKATVIKRVYEKAVAAVDNKQKVLPYQGKTVLIELKDGKYGFRYDGGGAITGDDAEWLDKEFNQNAEDSDFDFEEQLAPSMAVPVGGTWKVPMAAITKQLERSGKLTLDADKATGIGKLLKVYKKDGRQFGDLSFKLELPAMKFKDGKDDFAFLPGATLVMDGTMSVCIDGSVMDGSGKITWQMNGSALIPPVNPQGRLMLSIRNVVEAGTTEAEKK